MRLPALAVSWALIGFCFYRPVSALASPDTSYGESTVRPDAWLHRSDVTFRMSMCRHLCARYCSQTAGELHVFEHHPTQTAVCVLTLIHQTSVVQPIALATARLCVRVCAGADESTRAN